MAATVLAQALWVGLAGIALTGPVIYGLRQAAQAAGVPLLLPGWLLGIAIAVCSR